MAKYLWAINADPIKGSVREPVSFSTISNQNSNHKTLPTCYSCHHVINWLLIRCVYSHTSSTFAWKSTSCLHPWSVADTLRWARTSPGAKQCHTACRTAIQSNVDRIGTAGQGLRLKAYSHRSQPTTHRWDGTGQTPLSSWYVRKVEDIAAKGH